MSAPSSSLTPLLDGLAEQAAREVEAILAEARERAAAIRRRADDEVRRIESEAVGAGRTEGEREARRRIARAEIETRQQLARLRASALDEAVERATRRLAERAAGPDAADFLAGAIERAVRALGETRVRVRVRAEDRERVGALSDVGAEVRVDDEPLSEPGAVVSSADGRRLVDMTPDAIAARAGPAARRAAARALFSDDAGEPSA